MEEWKNCKTVYIDLCEYKNITCNFMQTFTEAARSNKMSKWFVCMHNDHIKYGAIGVINVQTDSCIFIQQ